MTPTHTHAVHGGRFAFVARLSGTGSIAGTELVTYHDLDKDMPGAMKSEEWDRDWRPVESDDCPVCLGAGTDQIKGNKQHPCGGCYGLGKVRADGETPTELWELADIAGRIIARRTAERDEAQAWLADAEVQAFIERLRQQRIDDATAKHEQEWRAGRGYGHGGQRHTGD